MRTGPAGALAALASSVVAGGVVLGTQLMGGATPPDHARTPSPGQVHASEVHEWVACKAQNGKDACTKPTPPGHLKVKPHGHDHAKDDADEPDAD